MSFNIPFSSAMIASLCLASSISAVKPGHQILDIWPNHAPGETLREPGRLLPPRPEESPPATRITEITRPTLHLFQPSPEKRNGAAVLVFPGGGYRYVVSDKEGSEAAQWLNGLGITAFVVHYRTRKPKPSADPVWKPPLEDAQRAVSLVRARASEWGISPDRIGVLGFSAGGQTAALLATRFAQREYAPIDKIDTRSCRPDFCLLIYPWQLVDSRTGNLREIFPVSRQTPPTFLVHAHDDPVTSLSSVQFYIALKKHRIPAEIHIYANGGHGYGMRPVKDSVVDTFPDRAADWLRTRGLVNKP